jgi:phosphatidylglycerol:prolipoprotein diacylglycerol transferase
VPFLAESLVHTVDPFAVHLTDTLLRWYGLSYATGFLVAWAMLLWLARTRRTPLTPALVGDFITWCILGVVVGGRLGHVLLYDRELLVKFTSALPFWGVLEIHQGGMASHGGIAGVVLASVIFARRHGMDPFALVDTAAFITPPGLMLGRLANWANGELPGKVLPDAMQASPPWWSIKYPREAMELAQDAATFERARELANLAYAGDRQSAIDVAALVPARYPNNFIQATTDGPLLMLVLLAVWWKPRAAGTLTGTFLVAYGVLRNVSESLREPDPDVFRIGPLTTPILISIGMVVLGSWIAWQAARSGRPLIGGIGRPAPTVPPA